MKPSKNRIMDGWCGCIQFPKKEEKIYGAMKRGDPTSHDRFNSDRK